jgi:hypothetical protein
MIPPFVAGNGALVNMASTGISSYSVPSGARGLIDPTIDARRRGGRAIVSGVQRPWPLLGLVVSADVSAEVGAGFPEVGGWAS